MPLMNDFKMFINTTNVLPFYPGLKISNIGLDIVLCSSCVRP